LQTAKRSRGPEIRGAMILVLLGPPGCGKGTQSEFLARHFDIPAISTGEMIRTECEAGTDLGKLACTVVASGGLVGDDVVNRIVAARIARPDCSRGFVLDGYPRTLAQAQALAALIRQRELPDPLVLHLSVADSVLVEPLCARRQCPRCKRIYNVISHAPRTPGRCDHDDAELMARDDDREPVIRRRLEAYKRQTRPVLQYYGRALVRQVDCTAARQQVAEAIRRAVT
jgi:adenylate kinase